MYTRVIHCTSSNIRTDLRPRPSRHVHIHRSLGGDNPASMLIETIRDLVMPSKSCLLTVAVEVVIYN